MRRRAVLLATATVLILAVTAGLLATRHHGRGAPAGPLTFVVDPSLAPSIAALDPIEGTDAVRSVGVYDAAELVLDEVMVHVEDQAELDGFLARWNGTVLDSIPADAEGQDHLVRVDASRADTAQLADDLRAVEPDQTGEHRASDERVLRLLALASSEWRRGTEVVLDWLMEPQEIEYGEAYEAADISKNVFDWSYMQSGGALDIGVGAAWQLLQLHGKLNYSLKFMVGDGGFEPNADFPRDNLIRKGDWGEKNA